MALVTFRYDDCSAVSSLDLERGLADVFGAAGAQITLGVIPRVCEGSFRDAAPQTLLPLSQAKAQFLRDAANAGHVEVALHGWNHQVRAPGCLAEFEGLDRSEQQRRIADGRRELEDLVAHPVTSFIPPWNAYDPRTVAILEESRFSCLSASLRGPFPEASTVAFLPFSCWLSGVRQTVAAVSRLRWVTSVIVVVLHDFDFIESGKPDAWISLDGLRSIVEELSREPTVKLCSLQQAVAAGGALPPQAFLPYARWRRRFAKLPFRFRHLFEDQAYWTVSGGANPPALLAHQAYLAMSVASMDLVPASWRKITRAATGRS